MENTIAGRYLNVRLSMEKEATQKYQKQGNVEVTN